MKISKFARQNYILLAIAGIFAMIVNAGISLLGNMDTLGVGITLIFFAGLATVGFLTALVVRLWEME